MARSPRYEASRARLGVPVSGERRPRGRSPVANGPAAAAVAWTQHNGTHLLARSDITMGSPSVPSSSRVGTQPGCTLADGFQDAHLPMCIDLQQPRGTDLNDALTLAALDAPQPLESVDIGVANLQTVFPLKTFDNQSSESIRASPLQSDGSLSSVVLSCVAGNESSNVLTAAPNATPPTAAEYRFHASPSIFIGPEGLIGPLPEIMPLEDSENVHMLDQSLFPPEQGRSLENCASSLPTPKQLGLDPNHFEGPTPLPMVNYDIPSYAHTTLPLFTPLGEMMQHAATHPQSFSFAHWHQQSPQQPLTDLVGSMKEQPLLGCAPFQSSPDRNDTCPMNSGARYPPSPNHDNVIPTAIVPNIFEAASTMNITAPFDYLQAQEQATSALPDSALTADGSAAHAASAYQTNVAARSVMSGRRGRAPRTRPPQSRQATSGKPRLREIRAPDASPATTVNVADAVLGRMETQRQKHMKSERQKRKVMNDLYAAMRSLLPPAALAKKIRLDNATIVQEMINDIKRKKNEIKMLEQKLKRSQRLVAALCNVNQSVNRYRDTAVESYLGLGPFFGTSVAINYCHGHYSLTVTSPYLRQAAALLEPMLIAIQNHHLEVSFASIMTTCNNYTVYYLQCKASPEIELLRNNLFIVLQNIVNNFPWTLSSQEHHG